MDIQLQELIDKIKKDGVTAAEKTAAEIVEKAQKEADSKIAAAEKKAEELIKNAKAEIERLEKASNDAVTQACSPHKGCGARLRHHRRTRLRSQR